MTTENLRITCVPFPLRMHCAVVVVVVVVVISGFPPARRTSVKTPLKDPVTALKIPFSVCYVFILTSLSFSLFAQCVTTGVSYGPPCYVAGGFCYISGWVGWLVRASTPTDCRTDPPQAALLLRHSRQRRSAKTRHTRERNTFQKSQQILFENLDKYISSKMGKQYFGKYSR